MPNARGNIMKEFLLTRSGLSQRDELFNFGSDRKPQDRLVCLDVDGQPWSDWAMQSPDQVQRLSEMVGVSKPTLFGHQVEITQLWLKGEISKAKPSLNITTALVGLPNWEKLVNPQAWDCFGSELIARIHKVSAARSTNHPPVCGAEIWSKIPRSMDCNVWSNLVHHANTNTFVALHAADLTRIWVSTVGARRTELAKAFLSVYGPQLANTFDKATTDRQIDAVSNSKKEPSDILHSLLNKQPLTGFSLQDPWIDASVNFRKNSLHEFWSGYNLNGEPAKPSTGVTLTSPAALPTSSLLGKVVVKPSMNAFSTKLKSIRKGRSQKSHSHQLEL